jgi:hypothetical protein
VTTPPAEMTEEYTDIFDFRGQVVMFRNFLRLSSVDNVGQGNCYIYYKRRFIFLPIPLYYYCYL